MSPNENHIIDEPAALVGKNNWLFLCGDSNKCIDQFTGKYEEPHLLERFWIEAMNRRFEFFDKLGIPYFFYIVPGKEYIYSDLLPDSIVRSKQPVLWERLYDAIRKNTKVTIRPLHQQILQARYKAEEPLYFRTDSHWNAFGAQAAANVVLEDLRTIFGSSLTQVSQDAYTVQKTDAEELDLLNKKYVQHENGQFTAIPDAPAVPADKLIRLIPPKEFKPQTLTPDEFLKNITSRAPVVTHTPNSKPLRAMVYRDSFASEMPSLLYNHFKDCTALWMPDISREAVEREKPDVVIQMMVDRFMSRAPRD